MIILHIYEAGWLHLKTAHHFGYIPEKLTNVRLKKTIFQMESIIPTMKRSKIETPRRFGWDPGTMMDYDHKKLMLLTLKGKQPSYGKRRNHIGVILNHIGGNPNNTVNVS